MIASVGGAAARRDDTAHLLWTDPAPAARRYQKSRAALEAVSLALARNRPLDGDEDEFLALRAAFDAVEATHRRRVWGDPQGHFWVRRAYQLVATCVGGATLPAFDAAYCAALGTSDPKEALRRHLADFKRFAVAADLLARRRSSFARPYDVRLPLAFPGTRLSLVGERRSAEPGAGAVAVQGVAAGRLRMTVGGAPIELSTRDEDPSGGVQLLRAPVVRVDTAEIVMQPHVFALPGLPFADELGSMPLDYQHARARMLRRSLTLMKRFEPRSFRTLASAIRVIALKPRSVGDFANQSHSELPGAIVCSFVDEPHVLAASIVHEVHHHRLFLLEEMAPLFAPSAVDAFTDARFYSPWREDLRPLQGIFHALYVYVPVLRFCRAAARNVDGDSLVAAFLRDRLARVPVQLRLGVLQLRRHARFSRFGAELFRALAGEVAALDDDAAAPSLDAPAMVVSTAGPIEYETDPAGRRWSVRDALLAHLTNSADGQCSMADARL